MRKTQDYYFKKAKKEGFPARSVYKLEEAQKKYRFLGPGQTVLDLGAYPGSWTKYVASLIGPSGLVVAVDLQRLGGMADNVRVLQGDVYDLGPPDLIKVSPLFDVVLSDMAPKTTGRRDVDHFRSIALAERALFFAQEMLRPGGTFFCKVFQGTDFPSFLARCRSIFKSARVIKPKSSRPESVEIFLLCSALDGK
ncbi:MAG: 50S rRNA methyltransferase [Nitrospiraceae bacterium]|nr:50S rRNA methyltransferase [Nitrospiraceae bacterium]